MTTIFLQVCVHYYTNVHYGPTSLKAINKNSSMPVKPSLELLQPQHKNMHLEKITASNYLECHKWIFFTTPKSLENQLWPESAYDNTKALSTAPAERTPAGAERSRHQLHRDRRGWTA